MRTYDEMLHDKELCATDIVDWLFEIMNTKQANTIYEEKDFVSDLAMLLERWGQCGERA